MKKTSNTDYEEASTWSGRIAVGVVLLVVLVVAGAALTIWAWIDNDDARRSAGKPAVTAARTDAYTSMCGQDARDFDKPASDFPAHPQTLQSGARIAVLDGVGPCRINDDIPTGYVFSPKGATLAAVNYASLVTAGGPDVPQTLKALQLRGAGTETMVADAKRRPLPATGQAVVKGVKVVATSRATDVRVVVAVEFPSEPGVVMAWTLTLTWTDHDWKVHPMDTTSGWEMSRVSSLTREGFTTWGF